MPISVKSLFIGNGEADAAVGVLEDIGAVMVEQPVDDDVAALDQPDARRRVRAGATSVMTSRHPGPAGIDERRARDLVAARRSSTFERVSARRPSCALGGDAAGARCGWSAPRSAASTALRTTRRESSTQQSEYSKPRSEVRLERPPRGIACEIERAGRRQDARGRRDGHRGTGRAGAPARAAGPL